MLQRQTHATGSPVAPNTPPLVQFCLQPQGVGGAPGANTKFPAHCTAVHEPEHSLGSAATVGQLVVVQPFTPQHPDMDSIISPRSIIMNIDAPRHAAAKYAFINALPWRMT